MIFRSRGPATFGAAVLLAAASAAVAGTSSSSVLITSFSYTTSAGTLSWSDPYQSFAATALNAGGLLGASSDAFDTNDYVVAIVGASTSNANAGASTTAPQTFWATASTVSSVGAISNPPNHAESSIGQSGSFTLSGAGKVTFTIGYKLDAAAPGGNPVSDHGSALLAFDAADSDGSSGGHLSDAVMSFAQASGTASRSGSFTMTIDLSPGETGFYNLQGNALAYSTAAVVAAVPEPTTWLLLSGGLAGMALRLRQRRRLGEI